MKVSCNAPEIWPIDRVVPNPRNPYKHTKEQIRLLAKCIAAHGWRHPIIVSKRTGMIVAGHARLKAAQANGYTEVPVDHQDFQDETQEMAVMLSDNQIDEFRGLDKDALELIALDLGPDFDFDLAGLPNHFIAGVGNTDPDAPQGKPEEIITKPGEYWKLGRHVLGVCDATVQANADRLFALGGAPKLMVTDPPYGVEYDPAWREDLDTQKGKTSTGKVENDYRVDWQEAWQCFPGDIAYVWHADRFSSLVQIGLESQRFKIVAQIIWAKNRIVFGRGDYHWQHEPCWYAVRDGANHNWQGARNQSTLWEIANNNPFGGGGEERFGHGTQKPIECMRRPILNNSERDDWVYDPFCGSGTTIVACEEARRRCVAFEIDPLYATMTIKRWEKFTGNVAEKIDG